jgi:hypothetical protein
MARPRLLPVALLSTLLAFGTSVSGAAAPADPSVPGTSRNFELVGHSPLMNRGMNAAPAVYDHYVYVGSRTDGAHPFAGVMIVDVADPSAPEVVGQILPPDEGMVAQTSRELRVWPQQKLLMVMNFQCSAILHGCASPADLAGSFVHDISFYDLTDPAAPVKVSSYEPSAVPHEMFLWIDPRRPGRALLYITTPNGQTTGSNLIVADISGAREGEFHEVLVWNPNERFPLEERNERDVRLHSIAVTDDGTRTFLAYLGGGMLVLDTTQVARGVAEPKVRLITKPQRSPVWTNMTVHSAVPVPGRSAILTTDEIYGDLIDPLTRPANESGCPWGTVHLVDIARPAKPRLTAEYRLPQNVGSSCEGNGFPEKRQRTSFACAWEGFDPKGNAADAGPQDTFFTSYAAHNPTVLRNLAFVTWHSGGFQAISLPARGAPSQAGWFSPEPLPFVITEDPALSQGSNKVVMWSYPIVADGLIYLVDVRNGLYVLRYTGPGAAQVARTRFLEGNSNVRTARA